MFLSKQCETVKISIYVTGDESVIRKWLQHYVMRGLCVTLSKTEYIYTYGNEDGWVVGLINYPRYPSDYDSLLLLANEIAVGVMEETATGSSTIVTDKETIFISRRPQDHTQEK